MNEPSSSGALPRVLIAAFQGWSDAGDATSEALRHLINLQNAELLHVISGEGYVDLQVQRPRIQRNEFGKRELEWPDTKLYGTVHRPGTPGDDTSVESSSTEPETITLIDGSPVHDLFFLQGIEPSRDWENFADEIVELAEVWAVDLVVFLGSMFSDAPHSRPIQATITSESADLRTRFGAVLSEYEGPTGVTSTIDIALEAADIDTLSLWVQVPHYVHSAPSPKATLALLDKLEELLDVVIPRGELVSQATEWENNINRIAANDDDMSRYIRSLEEARDDALAAETTGDALALEFEKFLERDSRKQSLDARNESLQTLNGQGNVDDIQDTGATEDTDGSPERESPEDLGASSSTDSPDPSGSSDPSDSSDAGDSPRP